MVREERKLTDLNRTDDVSPPKLVRHYRSKGCRYSYREIIQKIIMELGGT